MIKLSDKLIPVYNMMEEDLLSSDYVCCDELEPFAYMRHLPTQLPKCQTAQQIENLLPHKIDFKILN